VSIPFYYEGHISSSIIGIFCINKGVKYRCLGNGISSVSLNIQNFRKEEKKLSPGETTYVPPFTAHAFITNSKDRISNSITRISKNRIYYPFDIDVSAKNQEIPEDFKLGTKKIRIAEKFIKLTAIKKAENGLSLSKYSYMLHLVRRISVLLKTTDFETALIYGMAFDWINRLFKGQGKFITISYGSYHRKYSSPKTGYHDVLATEIRRNTGLFINLEHLTHFAFRKEIPFPHIKIERNVVIEGTI